jgi:peroxiredoxin
VEAPHLERLHRKYAARGLRVLGITPLDGPVTELHGFVRRHGLTYGSVVDPEEKVFSRYRMKGYPATVLLDRNGVVRWIGRGFRGGDEKILERRVRQALDR